MAHVRSEDLIFSRPIFHEKIWGGRRLETEFGYDIPKGPIGECWAISAHPEGDCVIERGPGQGGRLSELWAERPELFGDYDAPAFPLLVKIIDAEADLSIQVHPDDAYAAAHEGGSLGKRECWYVLAAEPGATIIVGQRASGLDQFDEWVAEGRWDELLNEIPVRAGDFFQIEPGTIHAIKAGTLLLETQQSSDITYRLYDYDRTDDEGNPRELHLAQAREVVDFERSAPASGLRADEMLAAAEQPSVMLERNRDYEVRLMDVHGSVELAMGVPFRCVSVVRGEGLAAGVPVRKGDHLIVPPLGDAVELRGEMRLVISHP